MKREDRATRIDPSRRGGAELGAGAGMAGGCCAAGDEGAAIPAMCRRPAPGKYLRENEVSPALTLRDAAFPSERGWAWGLRAAGHGPTQFRVFDSEQHPTRSPLRGTDVGPARPRRVAQRG